MSARWHAFRARVRRSTPVLGAIGAVWAWQATLALVASWPAASLARAAEAGDPAGDAWLWRPGSHALLAFLARDAHGVRAALDGAALVLVVGGLTGLVPLAILLLALESPARRRLALPSLAGRALRFFPALAALLVVFALAQAAVAGAGFFVASVVANVAHESWGEAGAEQLAAIVALVFLVGVATIGVIHDLARAAVVRLRVRAMRGALAGIRAFCLAPRKLSWGWGWRAAASLLPVALAAAIVGRTVHSGRLGLLLIAVVHQAVILLRLTVRASWLGCSVRSIAASDPLALARGRGGISESV